MEKWCGQTGRAETGFIPDQVLTFQVGLPSARYPDERLRPFAEALTERLRALPGVKAAGYANQLPLVALRDSAGGLWNTPDATRRLAPDGADARFVSRGCFDAFGIRVLAGRGLEARDGAGQPRVLLVNEALARHQFPGVGPVGLQVYVGRDLTPWTIVGVVGNIRQFGLDRAPEPQFFVDLRQWSGEMPLFPVGAYYVVKTTDTFESITRGLRTAALAVDPDATVYNVAPLASIIGASITRPRLYATLVGGFAALGAFLAGIGVYGVLAFLVEARTGEFGIRLALGASTRQVLGMVVRQGSGLVALGLALGTAGAAALSRLLDGLPVNVPARDPAAFVSAGALFAAIAAVAVLLPAWRATRVDPIAAIRSE